jgi:hypothetical protein
MQDEPSFLLLFGITVVAIASVLIGMAVVSRVARWGRGETTLLPERLRRQRESVNSSPVVMSRSQNAPPQNAPSSLETRPRPDPDQTEDKAARQKKLFDTYTTLKRLGLSRDAARAFLGPWGIPLDNNLWAQVPPEPEPEHVTPIAGRPTKASYYPDSPDLEYQGPPR